MLFPAHVFPNHSLFVGNTELATSTSQCLDCERLSISLTGPVSNDLGLRRFLYGSKVFRNHTSKCPATITATDQLEMCSLSVPVLPHTRRKSAQ